MFHSFKVLLKKLYSGVTITANVNELAAMIRARNLGGAYNIFRDIDRDFAAHYLIHGSKSLNFASQF